MYSDDFSPISGIRKDGPCAGIRFAAAPLAAFLLLAGASVACGDAGRKLPSHLAQKTAVELNNAGLQLHARESYKHSAMYFEFATMQNPAYYEGHYNRARALARTDEPGEALRALAKAYELNPEWVLARLADSDLDSIRGAADFEQIFADRVAAR